MDDEMQSIADAQHRHAEIEQLWVGGGRVRIVDGRRPAGEDEAERLERFDFGEGRGAGQHDGEDILLANAPRDQLRVLRTEVEDDDCLGGHDFSVAGRIVEFASGIRVRDTHPSRKNKDAATVGHPASNLISGFQFGRQMQ